MPRTITTDWVDWHEDPVRVVHGGSETDGEYHHDTGGLTNEDGDPVKITVDDVPVCFMDSVSRAAWTWDRSFAGPKPSDDPGCGFFGAVSFGRSGDGFWPGFCPTAPYGTFVDSGGPDDHGTFAQITNSSTLPLGEQSVTAVADLTGWQMRLWELYTGPGPSGWNVHMHDAALEAEFNAFIDANRPAGDGWLLYSDRFGPTLIGLEYAPDEPVTNTNDGDVSWVDHPRDQSWYYRYDGGFEWTANDVRPATETGFDPLAVYGGGTADWTPVPEAYLPTQDMDNLFTAFVIPDDEDAATIPITLMHENIMGGSTPFGGEGTVTARGRFAQRLVFRASWQLPRIQWRREVNTVPPRRIRQRSDGTTHGAKSANRSRNTRQGGNRVGGAIL